MKKRRLLSIILVGTIILNSIPALNKEVIASGGEASIVKIPQTQMSATDNTHEEGHGADKAIDVNADGTPNFDTIWHARYNGTPGPGEVEKYAMPQNITLDLNKDTDESYMVKTIHIKNRENNRIGKYQIYVANVEVPTENDFKMVKEGQFADYGTDHINKVTFDTPIKAQHIRISSLSSVDGSANLTVIKNIEVFEDVDESASIQNMDLVMLYYKSGGKLYTIPSYSRSQRDYMVELPEGADLQEVETNCTTVLNDEITITKNIDENKSVHTILVRRGTKIDEYHITYVKHYTEQYNEIPQNTMTATANTEQNPAVGNDGPASYAINGNRNNWWHARWSGDPVEGEIEKGKFPQYLIINLGAAYKVGQVRMTSRTDQSANRIKAYKLYVSTDGTESTYTKVKEDTNLANQETNFLSWNQEEPVQYIKLEVNGLHSGVYTTISDFKVFAIPEENCTVIAQSVADGNLGTVSVNTKNVIGTMATFKANPTIDGQFIGWFENEACTGEPISKSPEYSCCIDGDKTLYGKFDHVLSTSQMTVSAGSAESDKGSEGPVSYVIDGDTTTRWHSVYAGNDRENQYITVDFGAVYDISAIKATQRHELANGIITKYQIEVSTDNEQFYRVARGYWPLKEGVTNTVNLESSMPVRYVRLRSLESKTTEANKNFSALAELRLYGIPHDENLLNRMKLYDVSLDEVIRKGSYTTQSYTQYKAARNAAIDMIESSTCTQQEIDQAFTDYRSAVEGLREGFKTTFVWGNADTDNEIVETAVGGDISVPTPSKTGYEFVGWFTDEYAGSEVTEFSSAQTVYAHWVECYQISVSGGTIVGSDLNTVDCIYNSKIQIIADSPLEGQEFLGWYVNDKLISNASEYTYYATKNMNFVAKFGENGAKEELQKGVRLDDVVVMKSYVNNNKANIRFYGQVNMPKNATPVEAGVVWTTDATQKDNLIIDSANVKKAVANKISNIGQFSITITGAPSDVTMYGKMYVKYEGTTYYYSITQGNIVSGTATVETSVSN